MKFACEFDNQLFIVFCIVCSCILPPTTYTTLFPHLNIYLKPTSTPRPTMRPLVYVIIAAKIIFILLALYGLYFKLQNKTTDPKAVKVNMWKERMEFIFIVLMAILLLTLFNPRATKPAPLTGETRLLLYLFGIILLITADWGTFIHESPLLKTIQSLFSSSKRF